MGEDSSISSLSLILILSIFASAFFSGAETGIMSLNRYRLRHQAKLGTRSAQRILNLLATPDRFLSIVLIGNCSVNILAGSVATLIGLKLFGDTGVAAATGLLTIVLLIFGEIGPKTYAAAHPEKVAPTAAFILHWLLRLTSVVVNLINGISNFLFRYDRSKSNVREMLSSEELRTLVHESSPMLPHQRRGMLLGVLDLEKITVDDIMIPRHDVIGINIDDELDDIVRQLRSVQHTRLPVFKGELNNCIGILHVRNATRFLQSERLTKAEILQYVREPYYIPEGTSLPTQLLNFQKLKRRIGLVVDEYGDVQGVVTLEDILEEIVGDFTTTTSDTGKDIILAEDGSYLIDGSANIRDINRRLHWHLPVDGPKTLSGLIIEHLEAIPDTPLSMRLGPYIIEIVQTRDNMIRTARVMAAP